MHIHLVPHPPPGADPVGRVVQVVQLIVPPMHAVRRALPANHREAIITT
jgi:hypothetical protein